MTNPRTIDRRDVAHQANPVGDHEAIEEARSNLADLPPGVPPARSGRAQTVVDPAEPDNDNPGRMDQKRATGRDSVHVQSPDKLAQ
ncbi:hypothetical protein IHQ71_10615 [Rhizobium sp. TH2]|uniref:hypothetical protein n=1 Tax=Rhizobium sp. TH2 TaxID=2775403 RepID=UPI00215885B2|nr:hypothetical protein [Rhizobium sp. TH2]UVC10989.1 hypothetical protein IHQ71_10615 [Rhizobium sp. TH2]